MRISFAIAACLLAAAVSVPVDAAKPKKNKEFTASAPEVKGVWKAGEQISFFNGVSPEGAVYTCKELGFTTPLQGKGAATTEDGFWCAVYPASCMRMWTAKNAHLLIPREQTARKDGYPEDGMLLSACSEGRAIEFQPVMGYVKFTIDENSPATVAVAVRADKYIAGTFKVRMNEPAMRVELDTGGPRWHDVLLKSPGAAPLAPGTYYVGLFARVLPDGLTLERYAPDGTSVQVPLPGKITLQKGMAFDAGVIR